MKDGDGLGVGADDGTGMGPGCCGKICRSLEGETEFLALQPDKIVAMATTLTTKDTVTKARPTQITPTRFSTRSLPIIEFSGDRHPRLGIAANVA